MSKSQRREMPPAYVKGFEALHEHMEAKVMEATSAGRIKASDDHVHDFTEFGDWLQYTNKDEPKKGTRSAAQKVELILSQIRYCRVRSTWNKQKSMVELGLAPNCAEITRAPRPVVLDWHRLRVLVHATLNDGLALALAKLLIVVHKVAELLQESQQHSEHAVADPFQQRHDRQSRSEQ